MKYFFVVLIGMMGVSLQTYAANSYCDSRQSGVEIESCYKSGMKVHIEQIKKNYQILMQSPRLSAGQKQQLEQEQENWTNSLDNRCTGNIRCYDDVIKQRNYYLYNQLHKP